VVTPISTTVMTTRSAGPLCPEADLNGTQDSAGHAVVQHHRHGEPDPTRAVQMGVKVVLDADAIHEWMALHGLE
jgi:hypothetical protein